MRAIQSVLLLLSLITWCCHNVLCQVPFPENCPSVKIVDSFDLDRYMGIWYEYSKYPFIWEAGQKCQYAIYKNNGNNTVAVKNVGTFVIVNKSSSVQGTAKVIAPGQLAVAFRNQEVNEPNYLILGTDYDNWVVVYSCKNISSFAHSKIIWILSRQRQPSEEAIQAAKQVIKDNNLSEDFLMTSTQTDCPPVNDGNDSDQVADASTISDQTIDFSSTTPANVIQKA
ncbi:apolipoprotein D-like [Musca autumnalis]|uniref:apolipoprotein D-like n=1 Tax=Musca autumnalis TaxID=221902 RepID=UPI003CEC3577